MKKSHKKKIFKNNKGKEEKKKISRVQNHIRIVSASGVFYSWDTLKQEARNRVKKGA